MIVKYALLAAGALLALTARSSDALSYTFTPIDEVPANKRVSADQKFTQTYAIHSRSSNPITDITLNLPGRVFISHVDNTSSDASAADGQVLGRVKISGSTSELVTSISVGETTMLAEEGEGLMVRATNVFAMPPGALLVEVELLRKSAIKKVRNMFDCDVVVLENVLFSKDQRPPTNKTTLVWLDNHEESGAMFVSDKSSTLVADGLWVSAGPNPLQIELGGVKVNGTLTLMSDGASDLTLFTDTLEAGEAEVSFGFSNPTALAKGKTCISSSSKVNVTVPSGAEAWFSYPGMSTGAVACTKQELPKRVPVQVGKQGSGSGATPETAGSAAASWRGMSALMVLLTALSTSFLLAAL